MADYGVRDVERVLQISRSTILGLIKAGFVSPVRGRRGEYRFSFQDLIVLRTARALSAAKVSPRRITQSLKELRRHLPEEMPLSGLSIRAVGDRVVVQEGSRRWQVDSGQYLLELDIHVTDGELSVLARDEREDEQGEEQSAEEWFGRGWELEEQSGSGAREAYEYALQLDPGHAGACANLGRLLHEAGKVREAERAYREGLRHCGPDPLILFNLAVLLEGVDRLDEAIQTYEEALRVDPRFADCHYNLALAYELAGDARRAIRHLGEYRKLQRGGSR